MHMHDDDKHDGPDPLDGPSDGDDIDAAFYEIQFVQLDIAASFAEANFCKRM